MRSRGEIYKANIFAALTLCAIMLIAFAASMYLTGGSLSAARHAAAGEPRIILVNS